MRSRKILESARLIWLIPSARWVKVNTDGASWGCLRHAVDGGIFRGSCGEYIGGFSAYFGIINSLYAELMAAILTIDHANIFGFRRLWLECDSMMVIQAFSKDCLFHLVWEVDGWSAFKYAKRWILKLHTFMEKAIDVWIV